MIVLRPALWLAALATGALGLWLLSVIVAILPQRDPGRIPFWLVVAVGSIAFAAAAIVVLVRSDRSKPAAGPLAVLGSLAILAVLAILGLTLGVLVLFDAATSTSTDPEGYLLLVGLILAGSGGAALVWLGTRFLRRPAR